MEAYQVQSYFFNMTCLGNKRTVVLLRCHMFNNMTYLASVP